METRLSEQDNYIQSLEEQMAELRDEHENVKNKYSSSEAVIKQKDDVIAETQAKLNLTGQIY